MAIKFDFLNTAKIAGIITGALWAVNLLLGKLSFPVSNLYSSVEPVSAISGTIGTKTLAFIGSVIPAVSSFTFPGLVMVFISAFLILLAGGLLYDMIPALQFGKGKVTKLANKIILGSAAGYILVVGLVMQKWNIFAGLAIHTAIISYVTAWIAGALKINID